MVDQYKSTKPSQNDKLFGCKDSRNQTSRWGNQLKEAGPLTVTYNMKMLRFSWTFPISKIEKRKGTKNKYDVFI